ncbi:MAG TPA: DinB family protein [Acidimicrobiales bacterium]|nr:DinB family protein [Acidimicrobiales bacterium]
MAETTTELLLGDGDYVVGRLMARLEGMSDDEHGWRPVPDAWTVLDDGTVEHADAMARPDPAPLTSISWRLWHLANENVNGFAARGWDVEPALPIDRWFSSAEESRANVQAAWDRLRAGVVAKGEAFQQQLLGPAWGPYAEATYDALLLHVLDELTHHAAEVGMLRDLYRARTG